MISLGMSVVHKNMVESQNNLKTRMKTFCSGTALPGFKELYYTSSLSVRLTWIFLIIMAFGTATYQITNAIIQYQDHPTTTVIQPLNEPLRYVPIQICYLHWVYWVDWQKAYKLGFTKESILYGLSFMTKIYSISQFDIEKAKVQFEETMRNVSYKNLSEFYFAVAKDEPPGFINVEGLGNFTKKFHDYWSNEMCYLAVPTPSVVDTNSRPTVNLIYNEDFTSSREYVTSHEYGRYIFECLDSQIEPADLHDVVLPLAIAVDGRLDDVLVSLDIYTYLIKVQISVTKWKNSLQKPCRTDSHQLTPSSDCWQMCQLRNQIKNSSGCITFQQAITLNNESFAPMCKNDIMFFNEHDTTLPDIDSNAMNVATIKLISKNNESASNDAEYCALTCLPSCEEWRFDYNLDTKSFLSDLLQNRFTYVKVTYPAPSSILVMTEINSQTWESLVGNIGGLMGLWLGASITSVVQIICLCFCQDKKKVKTIGNINADNQQKVVESATKNVEHRRSWSQMAPLPNYWTKH